MVRTRQSRTNVRKYARAPGAAAFFAHRRLGHRWCRLDPIHGTWRAGGFGARAYAGITSMLKARAWPTFQHPVASAATAARRGHGSIEEGKTLERDIRSVLCARSAKAEAAAVKRIGPSARLVLDALEAADVAPTHLELPLFDIFTGHATAVDVVGVHRTTGRVVFVELKVHACSEEQLHEKDGAMEAPFHAMDNTLLNHAVCQILWAASTVTTQYGGTACAGLVVVVPPSGKGGAYCHPVNVEKGDTRLADWHATVRPGLGALFSTDAKHGRRKEAARSRYKRSRTSLAAAPAPAPAPALAKRRRCRKK